MGRPDSILGQIRETTRCRDAQHGDGVCCAFAPQLVVVIIIIKFIQRSRMVNDNQRPCVRVCCIGFVDCRYWNFPRTRFYQVILLMRKTSQEIVRRIYMTWRDFRTNMWCTNLLIGSAVSVEYACNRQTDRKTDRCRDMHNAVQPTSSNVFLQCQLSKLAGFEDGSALPGSVQRTITWRRTGNCRMNDVPDCRGQRRRSSETPERAE